MLSTLFNFVSLRSDDNFESVVRHGDVGGKFALQGCGMDVVGEMGEPGWRAAEIGGEGDGFIDAHVCGVRGEAQRVDDEHVEVLHEISSVFGDGFHVAHVSDALSFGGFEKETDGLGISVHHRQGGNAGLTKEEGGDDGVWVGVEVPRAAVLVIECVMERGFEDVECFRQCVDG